MRRRRFNTPAVAIYRLSSLPLAHHTCCVRCHGCSGLCCSIREDGSYESPLSSRGCPAACCPSELRAVFRAGLLSYDKGFANSK